MKELTVKYWQKFLFGPAKENSVAIEKNNLGAAEKEVKKLTGKIIPYRRSKKELF